MLLLHIISISNVMKECAAIITYRMVYISNELLHTHTTIEQYARSIYIEDYNKIRIRREILIINDEEIGNGRLTIICRRDTLIAFVVQ